jgi:hypothetical protein
METCSSADSGAGGVAGISYKGDSASIPGRALLQVPGAVGPLLLGVAAWSAQRPVAAFSLACGVVGSAASLLYFSQVYRGLGLGGMEHLAFDPLTVWTTVLGVVLLGRRLAASRGWRPSCRSSRSAVRAQETRFPALPSPRRFNDELVSGARPLLLRLS